MLWILGSYATYPGVLAWSYPASEALRALILVAAVLATVSFAVIGGTPVVSVTAAIVRTNLPVAAIPAYSGARCAFPEIVAWGY